MYSYLVDLLILDHLAYPTDYGLATCWVLLFSAAFTVLILLGGCLSLLQEQVWVGEDGFQIRVMRLLKVVVWMLSVFFWGTKLSYQRGQGDVWSGFFRTVALSEGAGSGVLEGGGWGWQTESLSVEEVLAGGCLEAEAWWKVTQLRGMSLETKWLLLIV